MVETSKCPSIVEWIMKLQYIIQQNIAIKMSELLFYATSSSNLTM